MSTFAGAGDPNGQVVALSDATYVDLTTGLAWRSTPQPARWEVVGTTPTTSQRAG